MKKVLIFGACGMAGHIITTYLQTLDKYEIVHTIFPNNEKLNQDSILLDIMETDRLIKLIEETKPDVIINAIGILIKVSKARPDIAIYVNSYFPHQLERIGELNNIKVIHLSTDCVFSGKKGDYKEDDFKDGVGFYAQSKALGEIINNKDLTFRTSIIGPELKEEGEGLFNWFMNQKGIINGYTKVFWSGVTTLELAKAIDKAIDQDLSGLYHLVSSNKISKFDLLKLIQKVWNRTDVNIIEENDSIHDKSLINTRNDFNYKVNDYGVMIKEMYDWIIKHKEMYKYET